MALGMALNGAAGETFDAMRAALRLDGLAEADLDRGYRDLIELLTGLDSRTEMRIANSIWGHARLPIEPAFRTRAAPSSMPRWPRSTSAARRRSTRSTGGCAEKTGGRIPRLLDELRPEEVLFLVNAIYFKGRWRSEFDADGHARRAVPRRGRPGPCRAVDAAEARSCGTSRPTDTRRVDLLYGNGAFAMTVLLPKAGQTPPDVLAGLDAAKWSALTGRFADRGGRAHAPAFPAGVRPRLERRPHGTGHGDRVRRRARGFLPVSPTSGRTGSTSPASSRRRSSRSTRRAPKRRRRRESAWARPPRPWSVEHEGGPAVRLRHPGAALGGGGLPGHHERDRRLADAPSQPKRQPDVERRIEQREPRPPTPAPGDSRAAATASSPARAVRRRCTGSRHGRGARLG